MSNVIIVNPSDSVLTIDWTISTKSWYCAYEGHKSNAGSSKTYSILLEVLNPNTSHTCHSQFVLAQKFQKWQQHDSDYILQIFQHIDITLNAKCQRNCLFQSWHCYCYLSLLLNHSSAWIPNLDQGFKAQKSAHKAREKVFTLINSLSR